MDTTSGCGNTVDIKAATAATGGVAVSSPVVFQYPVQPPRDDGRMLALASLLGGFMDSILGGDNLSNATAAENTWKDIADSYLKPRGQAELGNVDTLRALLPFFQDDLKAALQAYRTKADLLWPKLDPLDTKLMVEEAKVLSRGDGEWGLLDPLNSQINTDIALLGTERDKLETEADKLCTDQAFDALCALVDCGYTPDYMGIALRAKADAELAQAAALEDACRTANRYNMRRGQALALDARMMAMSATLVGLTAARETERLKAFEINESMRFKQAQLLEQAHMGRHRLAFDYEQLRINSLTERWKSHAGLSTELETQAQRILTERWQSIARLWLDISGKGDALSEAQWKMYSQTALQSLREGGEMLAAAGQAYQFLAASIRATAKQGGGGGITGLLTTLAGIIPLFSGGCDPITLGPLSFYPRPQMCCGTTKP